MCYLLSKELIICRLIYMGLLNKNSCSEFTRTTVFVLLYFNP
ncbi:hypothetical protein BACSTE_03061 [Bacteroides stercoris ATCC 43183]|uniref:Uncharacterized protein n=1 Tax=Bacteroides stercoris ATCC 43183 TaxID=449673 RepID=B0NU76_BACSE|nr:hypothetical protein BACSTE_03061 [Bacteroides stercoris ATCC 43183]